MTEKLYAEQLKTAFSLLQGASRIASTARDEPIERIGIPFHLLIGFAIELNLKAFLTFYGIKWQRSDTHNLYALMSLCVAQGLWLRTEIAEFVQNFSQYHREYWFRYPEKAGTANVHKPEITVIFVRAIYDAVFDKTLAIDHEPGQ